jgi:hypothetical protein
MVRAAILLVMFTLLISGCTAYRNDSLQLMQTLPEHHSHFDAQLSWKVTTEGGSTVISGVVKNVRYFKMTNLEVWVYSLDAGGKEVHRGMDFVFPLLQDAAGPFSVKLPQLASGTRLRFLYNYVGLNDDGPSPDAVQWSESFESRVP